MTFTPRFPQFLHGGDYNPDQWLDRPDILDRDIEMMHKAHVNCVSIGIFSWALLEPEEGVYNFDWLDEVIDRLWKGGIHIILATPSGARPAWMAQKYPEVLRVESNFQRNHFGNRHNHCPSSPVYRDTPTGARWSPRPPWGRAATPPCRWTGGASPPSSARTSSSWRRPPCRR